MNALCEPRGVDQQLPVGAPALGVLVDSGGGEPPIAGRDALVHRQDPAVIRKQLAGGVEQRLRRHFVGSHFQLRISGMSWPCRSMYWLCSISLSRMLCFR